MPGHGEPVPFPRQAAPGGDSSLSPGISDPLPEASEAESAILLISGNGFQHAEEQGKESRLLRFLLPAEEDLQAAAEFVPDGPERI